jgi:hypothetical protein
MAFQFSVAARNARLDAIETTIGVSPKLKFYTGSEPANCAAAATGTLLATLTLPSDFEANASSGQKLLNGTWSGTASAAGTVGYFRLYESTETTCHIQGTVTQTGSGGDMTFDNPVLANGQAISVSTFTITDGNS